MKNTGLLKIGAVATILCVTACSDKHGKQELPPAGTVLVTTSEPITDDTLNKFTFSLKLIVDSLGQGVYDVDVAYGPNTALGKFTMPKGIEDVVPTVRKGKVPYSYIVGFKLPDDTAFYEYYEVTGSRESIKMRYLNSYSFK